MTVEDELRATFARHEAEIPAAGPLHDKINTAFVRRKRRRAIISSALGVLLLGIAVPVGLRTVAGTPMTVTPMPAVEPASSPSVFPAKGLNVLLVAADRAVGGRAAAAQSVMVVHVPADRKHIYVVSLPSTEKGFADAAQAGDAAAALTGLSFDATITATPAAVKAVVDGVDGVPYCDNECVRLEGNGIETLLGGMRSKVYARDRMSQFLLLQLMAKIKSSPNLRRPTEVNHLLTVAQHGGLVVDGNLAALAGVAQKLDLNDVACIATPITGPQAQAQQSLYAALRDDDLVTWAAQHPAYRTRAQR
jgi:hypothetical protein